MADKGCVDYRLAKLATSRLLNICSRAKIQSHAAETAWVTLRCSVRLLLSIKKLLPCWLHGHDVPSET